MTIFLLMGLVSTTIGTKSIFWNFLYWKDHLLRHNLDVMHFEKNVFNNIMNNVLNVQGKSKDNLKSRLGLPNICVLRIMANSKGPVFIFRFDAYAKKE